MAPNDWDISSGKEPFILLCLNHGPVFEGHPDVIFAIDRHEIREAVPECMLKFGNAIQSLKLVEKGFDCRLPRLFVAYFPMTISLWNLSLELKSKLTSNRYNTITKWLMRYTACVN
jgi:hypothetical protein